MSAPAPGPERAPVGRRVALVTGASSGIGRAVAVALAGSGTRLLLAGRDEGRLEEAARACRAAGAEALALRADLGEDAGLEALAAAATSACGPEPGGADAPEAREGERGGEPRLDVLVHAAGTVALGPIRDVRPEDMDAQYRLNLRAPTLLTARLLPLLEAARGQVVFVNSGAGLRANPGWGAYAASKHGLRAVADALRAEIGEAGVRVSSVYPGRTASPMQERVRRMEGAPYDPGDYLAPEDVAAQVRALLDLPPRASVPDLSIRPA